MILWLKTFPWNNARILKMTWPQLFLVQSSDAFNMWCVFKCLDWHFDKIGKRRLVGSLQLMFKTLQWMTVTDLSVFVMPVILGDTLLIYIFLMTLHQSHLQRSYVICSEINLQRDNSSSSERY